MKRVIPWVLGVVVLTAVVAIGLAQAGGNKTEPAEQGGWNLFSIYDNGANELDPASHLLLRGNGKDAQFGWPTMPKIEELRAAWFDAKDVGQQKKICEQIQLQAFEEVPYIPLGQSIPPTAYRRDITGVLNGHPFFWNVRRQAT